jgi:hypothetical protein
MRVASWLAIGAALLLLTGGSRGADAGSPAPRKAASSVDGVKDFLQRHWQRPLAPQGPPPSGFSSLEASLSPAACGACHPQQYQDWRTALHSHAMSPGLVGQLQNMGPAATDEHEACLQCHAPLAEQARDLVAALAAAGRPVSPRADGAAYADGLTCAGCHVRSHRRFGPPRRDGTTPAPGVALPHGGWQPTQAFTDSRFCAACHQFETDEPALNGKPLENTYEEWRASRYAREDRSCQSCHMPDRRHLWRGIHDPAMTRSGLDISTSVATIADGQVSLGLVIANRGTGHAFPTYVTPHVIVEFAQEDRQGRAIPDTVERHLVARDVSLDLKTERADTRLLPDEVRRYAYDQPRHAGAVAASVRIIVQPDAFYAGFYRALLEDPDFRPGRATIRRALRRAERSAYVLYRWRRQLQ